MGKWQRMNFQPCLPLGRDGKRVTGCREHIELSRKAAGEGMVLLKNENQTLPIKKGTKLALFGKGCVDYVKGGGGSGDVTVAYIRTLLDGMKMKEIEGDVRIFDELADFYEEDIKKQYAMGRVPGMTVEPALPDDLVQRAAEFTDTAIITISRFSGEGWDRSVKTGNEQYAQDLHEEHEKALSAELFENGDFYLTNAEHAMVKTVTEHFAHVIVVMNVGGMVSTRWFRDNDKISAVLMAWQGGMEGGLAAADVLCGEVNPSGHLADTFAAELTDYPSTEGFHESDDYVNYTEDIYVGYRYFETIPGAKEKVGYPFGFGLSYTTFDMKPVSVTIEEDVESSDDDTESAKETPDADTSLKFEVEVKNTGSVPGRAVAQLYGSAPQGKLGKPARVLIAFAKTKTLKPGETETVTLTVSAPQLASYDDTGKICRSAWVLEAGTYRFFLGENVRDAKDTEFTYEVAADTVLEQLEPMAAEAKLPERLRADGTYEKLPCTDNYADSSASRRKEEAAFLQPMTPDEMEGAWPEVRAAYGRSYLHPGNEGKPQLIDVAEGRMTMDAFVEKLPLDVRIRLLGGQPNTGVANTFGFGNEPDYGIPNVMTADGPAGLRIAPECGIKTTAFPCATALACTWDPELVEKIGAAGAEEVKENNIGVWLTPACNIHRSPLCGRNFEYYSEDPFLAGKTGAAMVRGIQSRHIGASVKHFAANNKETNRKNSDSRVSERALREIYLKQFEIIVKEAQPYTIMSSYNLVNGIHSSENHDLLTGILRDEWGFEGMVTTDWWTFAEQFREIKAGNDVKMGCGYPERVKLAYDKGLITDEEINTCVKRVLGLILKMD
ncbi:MAG: glycoside hydrolase family 3 C-terminal domain-containing protein [Eubacteriales bacterium]|nr:glycoside hydrolase family 3 C-terminal domain-containing protein [Eubacteriales bacterium]